ncbi:hypothetical protein GUJ93_ZPchr0001g29779 [Zizania palustris]|uniref:Uncharacterized protein n=1 Tax=Zizania palustris TaxID=103762 RepID=A0A8J5VDZ4_ZIZPA|nr:hypothetical protein GUJ93_ZPchr0001g29779 [Zizania palustris]
MRGQAQRAAALVRTRRAGFSDSPRPVVSSGSLRDALPATLQSFFTSSPFSPISTTLRLQPSTDQFHSSKPPTLHFSKRVKRAKAPSVQACRLLPAAGGFTCAWLHMCLAA